MRNANSPSSSYIPPHVKSAKKKICLKEKAMNEKI